MKPSDLLTHPKLRKFVRKVPTGSYLFRQGDSGNSMFMLLGGSVELIAEKAGRTHIAGVLESGDFLGEKAFLSHDAHIRRYSARAKEEATVLEISNKDLEFMKIAAPELTMTFMVKAFDAAVRRLENVNYLVQALRPADSFERLVGCILYFCRVMGKEGPEGINVKITLPGLHFHIDAPESKIAKDLQALQSSGVLRKVEADEYLVADLSRLEGLFKKAA